MTTAGVSRLAEPHQAARNTTSFAGAEILKNKWMQAALIVVSLFFIYYITGDKSNLYNQDVRLAESFLHGRLYIEHAPSYLELAQYYDNGTPCKGPEVGCKEYVVEPPLPAVLFMPFVAVFGINFNQVLLSMVLGAAAIGLFWVASRQKGLGHASQCGDHHAAGTWHGFLVGGGRWLAVAVLACLLGVLHDGGTG